MRVMCMYIVLTTLSTRTLNSVQHAHNALCLVARASKPHNAVSNVCFSLYVSIYLMEKY